MVWTSLFQLAYPVTIFIVREAQVWEDLMGQEVENSDWTQDHYTDEIKAWEQIMVGHSLVWGPMFILGILGLSEVLESVNSRLIEHWVSNLHIPMYIYGTVKLLTVAIDSSAAYDWVIFGVYTLLSGVNGAIQMLNGTDAQYFLIEGKSKWADQILYPSLFYLINWIDHTPRYFQNDYYGGYGYDQPKPYYL